MKEGNFSEVGRILEYKIVFLQSMHFNQAAFPLIMEMPPDMLNTG
jgi:hypothetical protein